MNIAPSIALGALCLGFVGAFGCAATDAVSEGTTEAPQTAGPSAPSVTLVYARRRQAGCSSCFVVEGYAEVDRPTRQGGVLDDGQLVLWRSHSAPGSSWSEERADLVETSQGIRREVWHFIAPADTDTQFALRYDVRGQSYWDNNTNANYRLNGEGISVSAGLAVLGAGHDVVVTGATPTNEGISGQLLVRQGLHATAAAVAYGTTGMTGWQSVAADAQDVGLDHQLFAQGYSFAIPLGTSIGQVDFAASAETGAKGQVWDSNLGKNYRCVTTGGVVPQWICPNNPTLGK